MADPSEFQFIVTICTVSKFFVVSNLLWKKIKIQKFLKVTFSFKKWQQNEDLGRKYLSSSSHDHQMILKSFFLLGSDTQQFLRAFIAEIEPATFGNHRTEEWHFDCAQLGGIRRYFTFKILTRFSPSWNESSSIQWFINSATMCREGYRIACWIKVCNPSSLWAMTPYYWSLWVSTC